MKADEASVAAAHDIDARGVDARLLAHKRVNRTDDIIHLNASDVTAETVEERIAIAEGAVVGTSTVYLEITKQHSPHPCWMQHKVSRLYVALKTLWGPPCSLTIRGSL